MSPKGPIYVFDHVRSNSQLFNKLFAIHPQLEQIFMPMIAASLHGPEAIFRGRQHGDITEQTFQTLAIESGAAETETYGAAFERIETATAGILGKGKIPWLKDHAFCVVPRPVQDAWLSATPLTKALQRNPTVFTTQFLDSVTPVFLIRHPALSIPSFFRKDITICKNQADDEDFAVYSAQYWSRLVFDSFLLRSGPSADGDDAGADSGKLPIVVDAADVIYNSESILRALCERLGIDFSGVQFSWDPLLETDWPTSPVMKAFFADLFRSSGVEKRAEKPSEEDMDLDRRQLAWSAEFGQQSAVALRTLVDRELKHYEYLKKFKLRP